MENKGRFPPNIQELFPAPPWPHNFWFDIDRIGRYLPGTKVSSPTVYTDFSDALISPVMVCPEDAGASLSYR